ncbi:Ig-like domain-containing protein, partial [Thermoanaerobacterium sp. DL9XJH110]|uniref:Ig-like domain-containing protein n=1 Tax=Thermoanaerobacterium sp. DL9XJH110 TaxID=3386643 RepID=UPI003BB6652E
MNKKIIKRTLAMLLSFILVFSGMGFSAFAEDTDSSSVMEISNGVLSVSYDKDTNKFTVSDPVSGGATFLREGQFADTGGTPTVETTSDPTFGSGKSIKITYSNGDIDYISLYSDIPYVFFKSVKFNNSSSDIVLNRINTVSASVDLGVEYSKLVTFGTGGLYAPDKNPGSYVFLATVDPSTRKGVVGGWLTQDRGSGVIFTSIENNLVRLNPRLDYGTLRIPPDSSATTETFVIGYFEDARSGLERFADMIAQVYNINLPPQPSGYCTWYSDKHGGSSDETYLEQLADFAAQNLKPYGFDFIQIDDGWQEGIKDNGPRKNFTTHRPDGPYPGGMKAIADKIKARGLTPGLWFMPFAGNHRDPYFAERQDWFVKNQDGTPYETSWGGTSLDMTNPEVRQHVADVVNRITNNWGFKYLKMDGLYTGIGVKQVYVNDAYKEDNMGDAVFYDPNKTNVEAFRDGLKLVRENAGDDVFLLGCTVAQNMRTLGAAMGLVDAMRIGPDNGAGWSSLTRGPRYGSRFYFLHGRVWYNDPDPVYIRNSMPFNESRYIASWVGVTGQMTVDSDWLPDVNPDRLELLKRIMPAHGLKPRPVDIFERDIPRIWLLAGDGKDSQRYVIGLFNSDDTEINISESLDRIGISGNTVYEAYDFWNNKLLEPISGTLDLSVPAHDARVIEVRPVSDHPQVISTSRHITQGMVDLASETWDSAHYTLTGVSRVVGNDSYELRIVARNGWTVQSVQVSDADKGAGVNINYNQVGDLIRVTINSPVNRDVSWSVKFTSIKNVDIVINDGNDNGTDTAEVALYVSPVDATNKNIKIEVENPAIATVENITYDESTGMHRLIIRGIKGGKTAIKAISEEDPAFFATCRVNVYDASILVNSIELSETTVEIKVGGSKQLIAKAIPEEAFNKELIWISSDENVVSVTQDGIITGKSIGSATIKVQSVTNPAVYAECKVNVSKVPVTQIVISKPSVIGLKVNETCTLQASVLPDDATNKSLIWESSDTNVVIVDNNGKVVGNNEGVAYITVKSVDNPEVYAKYAIVVNNNNWEQMIEAESGTIIGNATIRSGSNFSGGKKVGYVGSDSSRNGKLQIDFTVEKDEYYAIDVYYAVNGTRYLYAQVNDMDPVRLACTGSSAKFDYPEKNPVTIVVPLKSGTNRLLFFNNSGWGPDLDRITISKIHGQRCTVTNYEKIDEDVTVLRTSICSGNPLELQDGGLNVMYDVYKGDDIYTTLALPGNWSGYTGKVGQVLYSKDYITSFSKKDFSTESGDYYTVVKAVYDGAEVLSEKIFLFTTTGVSDIEILPSTLNLSKGDSAQFDIIIKPDDATNKDVKISSSDETVAIVENVVYNEDGSISVIIKAIGSGSAIITVESAANSSCKTMCMINVRSEEPVAEPTVTLTGPDTVQAGSEFKLNIGLKSVADSV